MLFLFASSGFADLWAVRSYIELLGQYSLIFNARDVMAVPADGNMTRAVFSPTLDFNGVFMFGGDDGIYSFYVKKDHIELKHKNTVLLSATDGSYITNDEQWGLHYIGLGGRKYFFIDNWNMLQILPYAGLDLGGYFTSNTTSKLYVKDSYGSLLASGEMEANGGFFGVNVEAGADFWVMNEFALIGKVGYRFCGGTIRSSKTSDTKTLGPLADVYDVETDYSGFYIQFGVTMNFQRYD
jgi:hypothetical protein